jgi:hypothetical protein
MDDTISLYGLDNKDIELVKVHKRQGLSDISYFAGSMEGLKRAEEDQSKLPLEQALDLPSIPLRVSSAAANAAAAASLRASQSLEGKSMLSSKKKDINDNLARLSMIFDGFIVGRPHLLAPSADAMDASVAIILYCPCSLLKRPCMPHNVPIVMSI